MDNKTKVVVGLSGGVDSSVSAALLIEQGYEVIGIFMKNWNDSSLVKNNECAWIDDSNDALLVAQKLNIPFHVLDLSEQYKKRIVDYMIEEYHNGRTPNPDVLCNREIKFDIFLNAALSLGAKYVATGHYCKKDSFKDKNSIEIFRLLAGKDPNKDQSYFLCQITQYQLSKALFPIGDMLKSEVRELAKKYNLITADKKDSQGLCFIGKIKLPQFLQQRLEPKKGEVLLVENDSSFFHYLDDDIQTLSKKWDFKNSNTTKLGYHNGVHSYTVGQRRGLKIGGTGEPLFVLEKDPTTNTLYVGKSESHLGLYRKGIQLQEKSINWIRKDLELTQNNFLEVHCRIRYRQELIKCILYLKDGKYYIIFQDKINSVASGQFAAWYINDELIGSAVID